MPEAILQNCLKVANEPPSDMKSNMRSAYAAFPLEMFDRPSTDEKKAAFRSILFGLCFYHSLLLGRKKFGVGIGTGSGSGLGFCRGYSFNTGDLVTCGDVLINYLESYDEIPFGDLRYMFGEVFYGGHITDAMDRRCCTTYLDVSNPSLPACLTLLQGHSDAACMRSAVPEVHSICFSCTTWSSPPACLSDLVCSTSRALLTRRALMPAGAVPPRHPARRQPFGSRLLDHPGP